MVPKKSKERKERSEVHRRKVAPAAPVWWQPLLVVLLGTMVYGASLRNGFTNWDDQEYITDNRDLSEATLHKHFVEKPEVMGNYHPVTMLSLAWSHGLAKDPETGQLDPSVFHRTDLLLHMLCALLVYVFITGLVSNSWAGLFTALLFVAHPMHVESVAWASARKDLLYTFFLLCALVCYLRYVRSSRAWWLAGTLLLFALSLLSKAMAVSLVPLLLLIDWYHGRKWNVRALLEKVPFIALALYAGLNAVQVQHDFGSIQDSDAFPFWQRAFFACYGLTFYIVKFIWPSGLSAFHGYPAPGEPLAWYIWIAPVLVAVICVLVWRSRHRREVVFGAGFFLFTVVHVLQLLAVGGAMVAERYTYSPYVGLALVLTTLVMDFAISRKLALWAPVAMLSIFVLTLAGVARERSLVWKDGLTLWADAFAKDGSSPRILSNYGVALNMAKRYPEALAMLDRALQRKTDYAEAFYNRGLAKYYLGRHKDAIDDYTHAIELSPALAVAWHNRAGTYFTMGRPDLALPDALKARELGYAVDPKFIQVLEQQMAARP